ncbi:MAG TPA: hypothetical protein VHQ90_21325 [Thermoanaerobaculia bacterium]|nr:hypothetical protein [Thermoanaerobaculia bacterium]
MKTITSFPALRLVLAAAAIGLLGPTAAAAAPGELAWTRWGPGQGAVRAMAFDPASGFESICFAPLFGGVFCSRDGGASIQPENQGLNGDNVVALAADPARGRLLAVAAGGKLYWRERGDWQPLNDGSAWASTTGQLLRHWPRLVPGPERLYLAAGSAVFRSDDAGESWARVLTTQAEISGLVLDPASPDTLYVSSEPGWLGYRGSGIGGLLKSTDGGATWTSLAPASWTSPPSRNSLDGVASLAVAAASPQAPAAIYAATGKPGLFRSRDGGVTWEELASGHIPGEKWLVTGLAIDPVSPATVIASRLDGLYVSTDGGTTWSLFNPQYYAPAEVLLFQVGLGARPIYAATPNGVYTTDGTGGRWTTVYETSSNGGTQVRFHPADRARVYAVVGGVVLLSGDGGVSWSRTTASRGVYDLAFAPPAPHRAAAALYSAAFYELQRSDDGGASWKKLPIDFALAVAPLRQRTVLAGGYGASRSLDRGETWVETLSSRDGRDLKDFARLVSELRVDPADSRRVYARVEEYTRGAPAEKHRVFVSLDSGASWSAIFEGSDVVAIDPRQPGALYVLAGTHLFKSIDSGASFVRIPTVGLAGFVANDLVVDPASPTVLYAAGVGGVRRSVNGGRTWTAANRGLETQPPRTLWGGLVATRLFFAPAVPHLLYVAANDILYRAVFP